MALGYLSGILMATKCIVCEKDKTGTPVSDDVIIGTIRKVKRTLRVAQENRLVVCKDCLEEHKKRRAKFEAKVIRYGGFGAIVTVIFLIISQRLVSLLAGLFVIFVMLFLTLNDYWPTLAVEPKAEAKRTKRK